MAEEDGFVDAGTFCRSPTLRGPQPYTSFHSFPMQAVLLIDSLVLLKS
jgi:hypothetical protein